MLKTTQELKDFILWAKEAKIQAFKYGQVEVQFSTFAFIDATSEISPEAIPNEERDTSKTMVDTLSTEEEDEDLLFFSAKP
jgi:hypothetical protein